MQGIFGDSKNLWFFVIFLKNLFYKSYAFLLAQYREGERRVLTMFAEQTSYKLLLEPERGAL